MKIILNIIQNILKENMLISTKIFFDKIALFIKHERCQYSLTNNKKKKDKKKNLIVFLQDLKIQKKENYINKRKTTLAFFLPFHS